MSQSQVVPNLNGGLEDGNDISNPPVNALYHWHFRISKDKTDAESLQRAMVPKCKCFKFQLEQGDEKGYEHYQGQMTLKTKEKWKAVREWMPRGTYIEKTRNLDAAYDYSCKEDTRIAGPWEYGKAPRVGRKKKEMVVEEPLELIVPDKPFQVEILELLASKADNRSIYWYWSTEGNLGKSQFARYICATYNALYCNGKKSDILYSFTQGKYKIVIIDIERDEERIPYSAMESLKNGIFFCGKYESRQFIFNPVHLIVFANRAPELQRMSLDRWKIKKIE